MSDIKAKYNTIIESTSISDWKKEEKMFGCIILDIIESKYRKYEDNPVPLETLKVKLEYFRNRYVNYMQEIAKLLSKPGQKPEPTAKEMLGILCQKGEIKRWTDGVYQLTKSGHLYKHLVEKITQ